MKYLIFSMFLLSACSHNFIINKIPRELIAENGPQQKESNKVIAIRFPAVVSPKAKDVFTENGGKIVTNFLGDDQLKGFSEITILSSTYYALELFKELTKLSPNSTIVLYPVLVELGENGQLIEKDLQQSKLPADIVIDFSVLSSLDSLAFVGSWYVYNIRVAPKQSKVNCGVLFYPRKKFPSLPASCESDDALDAPYFAWHNVTKPAEAPKSFYSNFLPLRVNASISSPLIFEDRSTGLYVKRPEHVKNPTVPNPYISNLALIITNVQDFQEFDFKESSYLRAYDEDLFKRASSEEQAVIDPKNIELIKKLYNEEKRIQKIDNEELATVAFKSEFGTFYRAARDKGYSAYNKGQLTMWLTAGVMIGVQTHLINNGYTPLSNSQVNQIISGTSKVYYQQLAPSYKLVRSAKVKLDEKLIEVSYSDSESLSKALIDIYKRNKYN